MPQKHSFEDKLSALESIVLSLEEGSQTLDEALSSFEDGIKLVKDCKKELTEANKKVDKLFDSESK